jgi:hypothetical protein
VTSVADNRAVLRVRTGPLLGPVLSRVIGMLAARAQCPIDRLDDALLVSDAVAAHSPRYTENGPVAIELAATADSLELVVGGLAPNGAQGLLADAELPGVGNVLERVAQDVSVETGGEGGERLRIRLSFNG